VVVKREIFVVERVLCKYFHNSEKLIKKTMVVEREIVVEEQEIIVAERFPHYFIRFEKSEKQSSQGMVTDNQIQRYHGDLKKIIGR
jgi:hypothetical protein